MTGSMDHRANVYSLTEKLGAGNRAKSSMESDRGLKRGGVRSQIRTGLYPNFPAKQGKNREFRVFSAVSRILGS